MTTAASAMLAVLKANGIDRIFGNPGTTELALLDATVSGGIEFHLCLHEGAAVAMADGYGRATNSVGVVMVHTSVGAANTLTNLINARSDSRPLLVIAGDKDDRLARRGAFCEVPDLPGLLRQVTKEAWQVGRPDKLPELTLRALGIAQAPTPGAVFLGVHENHLGAPVSQDCVREYARRASRIAVRAHSAELQPVLQALTTAQRPLLVAGNEVGAAGAAPLLAELASRLVVPVVGEEVFTMTGSNFPSDHALYHGSFSPSQPVVRDADLVVFLGSRTFMEYTYPAEPYLPAGAPVMQIGSQPTELGRLHPADWAVLGEVGAAIQDLLGLLGDGRLTQAQVQERRARAERKHGPALAQDRPPVHPADGMRPSELMRALDMQLPGDATIVDESVLSKSMVQQYVRLGGGRRYFGTSGGGLGWGIPAAIGVQLGLPGRRTVAVVGDGGALFNIQSLWTAAHLQVPVVAVVVNNGGYMAVRRGLGQYAGEAAGSGQFPGSFIARPEVDLCRIAEGFGVSAVSVRTAADFSTALHDALRQPRPVLLDARVDPAAYF